MRLIFTFALAVALLGFTVGCENTEQSSAKNRKTNTAKAPESAAKQEVAATPPPVRRVTTSQPLPQGWSYINRQELGSGPLASNVAYTPASATITK